MFSTWEKDWPEVPASGMVNVSWASGGMLVELQSSRVEIITRIVLLCALVESSVPSRHILLPFEMVCAAVVPHTLPVPRGDTPTYETLAGRLPVRDAEPDDVAAVEDEGEFVATAEFGVWEADAGWPEGLSAPYC
ncbi:MAG TPA: hypothetical protein VEI81_01375 [Methanoregula sp.]|nr:hypothetical protein [Methanoregula sp.]